MKDFVLGIFVIIFIYVCNFNILFIKFDYVLIYIVFICNKYFIVMYGFMIFFLGVGIGSGVGFYVIMFVRGFEV